LVAQSRELCSLAGVRTGALSATFHFDAFSAADHRSCGRYVTGR
ncbi:hypothetical protein T03_12619, partial [Trichinella britovi]